MSERLAELVRRGYEEAFAGNPTRLLTMTAPDYRHYGADSQGGYSEFTGPEVLAILVDVAARTEATNEVTRTMALGDEIVLLEVRGTRRSRLSGASVEFRTATLVNILDGRIVRTAEISEQSQLEFWRSIRGRG